MPMNRLFTSVLVLLASQVAQGAETAFEAATDMDAEKILPEKLLQGPHHRIDSRVRSDGYLNYYTIQSDFGEFEAVSTAMLRMRVGEIEALAALDELSKTEVFAKAAAEAGVKQLKTLQAFATKPVATVKGIPSGVGRMFKRYKRQAEEAVDAAQEFVTNDEEGESGESSDDESTTDKAVELTESYLGVGKAQRAWARKLGTDPYSRNEVLQAAVKEVAWAERLGKLGMGFAGVPKIPGADIIADVNDLVWSKDPYELKDLNRSRLVSTGAGEELIEDYLENRQLTPTQQTLLTAAIAELEEVNGRDGILRQSLQLEGETEVNFFIKSVTMLAWYHRNQNLIIAVETSGAIPAGLLEEGTMVLTFATDHIYWTETIADAADRYGMQAPDNREVWFLGTASDRSVAELEALGFRVNTQVSEVLEQRAD